MLKVRLMGSRNDIRWFQDIMNKCKCLEVTEQSDIFENKGTNRFFRNYLEVKKTTEKR